MFDVDSFLLSARYGDYPDFLTHATPLSPSQLSTQNSLGNTALHFAAANNHPQIVGYLVSKLSPALINLQNQEGNTPLHWACLNGHKEIVELLIKNGSDPCIVNKMGKDSIFEAQSSGKEEIVDYLLENLKEDGDWCEDVKLESTEEVVEDEDAEEEQIPELIQEDEEAER